MGFFIRVTDFNSGAHWRPRRGQQCVQVHIFHGERLLEDV